MHRRAQVLLYVGVSALLVGAVWTVGVRFGVLQEHPLLARTGAVLLGTILAVAALALVADHVRARLRRETRADSRPRRPRSFRR